MYDAQPQTPKPIELAAALARGDATPEQCRLAAQWIADATKATPGLTPDMLSEEDRKMLLLLRGMALHFAEFYLPQRERTAIAWADRLLK